MAEVDETKVIAGPDGSNDETERSDENSSSLQERLTGEDTPSEPSDRNMDVESPSSELENLASQPYEESDSGESMASGREGVYEVNPESETKQTDENKENIGEVKQTNSGRGSIEPAEKKLKTDRALPDGGSRPASVASSSGKSSTPGKDKDPLKREKDKDREERIRQAQVRLADERQKKLDEMKEQQRLAKENREKQLEERRKKIEDLKLREEERRKQVEERRRTMEEVDKAKKEAILSKAKERLTRYEQWKAHGRKGGRKHVLGFGSRTPREVCFPLDSRRSSSQSTLRRSPNSSDYDSYFHRRAVSASSVVRRHCCIDINKLTQGTGYPGQSPPSKQLSMSTSVLYSKRSPEFSSSGTINKLGTSNLKSGAESLMALNTIPENRLRRSLPGSLPPSRHKSAVNVASSSMSGVKMRDPNKMSPRKQRPYSVGTSMPSFVKIDMEPSRPSRSKSTDRVIRDASKTRTPGRKEEDKVEKEKKAATLPRPYDRKKIEERRLEAEQKRLERKEREREREKDKLERMSKSETHEKEKHPTPKVLSKSFIERMAAPKNPSPDKKEPGEKELTPVKTSTPKVKVKPMRESPAKSSPKPAPIIKVDEATEGDANESDTSDMPATESVVKFSEPEVPRTPPRAKPEPKQVSPEPSKAAKTDSSTPKTDKEREMEEYKNKLAERRRLAREKAEREAEIERIRQDEMRRQEEERQREEEERQRREEEESLRMAEEARKAEEERLARAIEAEEKRKKDEAERLERERIQKEEADKKAKEEAERLEKEKQEKARKEEEEKVERRKRLDEVMRRFKSDSPSSTPEKRTESPPRVVKTEIAEDVDTPKLKVEVEAPKFKSPLLQSIMGKTKLGARLSSTRLDEMGRSTEKLSSSTDHLSDDEKVGSEKEDGEEEKEEPKPTVMNGHGHTEPEVIAPICDTDKQESETKISIQVEDDSIKVTEESIEVKDTSENEVEKDNIVVDNGLSPLKDSVIDTSMDDVNKFEGLTEAIMDSQMTVVSTSTADSAVSLSFNGVSSHNGDFHTEPKELVESKELVDSSISMRTADSFASSQTGSIGGSLVDSQNLPTSDSTQFEEVIDLNVHVTNKTLKAQQLAENLYNHNLNDNADITMSDSSDSPTHTVGKPIIAFEDNATRRQDVPDLLS